MKCIVFLQLSYILNWAPVPPITALGYFSHSHPLTAQYATRVLQNYPPQALLFYVPQLVQAVRYDTVSFSFQLYKTFRRVCAIVWSCHREYRSL